MNITKKLLSFLLVIVLIISFTAVFTVAAEEAGESSGTATERTIAVQIAPDQLKAGDKVFICNESSSVALSTKSTGKRVSPCPVVIEESEGKKTLTGVPTYAAALEVGFNDGGALQLCSSEGYLTVPDGGGLTYSSEPDTYSEWEIRDSCFLYNLNYTYKTYNNYYLQYYAGGKVFSTYGMSKSSDPALFTMGFYLLTDETWGVGGSYRLPLFETSDTHGFLVDTKKEPDLYYLARIGKIVRDARTEEDAYDSSRAMLLDTGDIYQGEAISNLFRGNYLSAAYDAMDYDAVSIGNHEFDWGLSAVTDEDSTMMDYFLDGVQYQNNIPVVLSNLWQNKEKVSWLKDFVILNKIAVNANGESMPVKIAVIGFAENYAKSIRKQSFEDLGYEIREDYDALNELASSLESTGACDATVVLYHGRARSFAYQLGKDSVIDLVLGGHTHYNDTGKNIWGTHFMQPESFGASYGYAELVFNTDEKGEAVYYDAEDVSTVSVKNDPSLLYNTPENAANLDAEVTAVSQEAVEALRPKLQEEIGYITTDVLRLTYLDGDKKRNCTAGNWESEIYRNATGADVSFINSGGLRTEFRIPEGSDRYGITMADVYSMFPFNNTLYLYEISCEELLSVLQYSLTSSGKSLFSYLDGIDCYYDGTTVNAIVRDGVVLYKDGVWADGVSDSKITLVVNDYIATTDRVSSGLHNPLIAWNETDRLIDNTEIDNEAALEALHEQSAENDGYLHIDTHMNYINGRCPLPKLLGDADFNGVVDTVDATTIQRYDVGILSPDKIDLLLADADKDGEVGIIDVTWIQRWELKMKAPAGIGEPIDQ